GRRPRPRTASASSSSRGSRPRTRPGRGSRRSRADPPDSARFSSPGRGVVHPSSGLSPGAACRTLSEGNCHMPVRALLSLLLLATSAVAVPIPQDPNANVPPYLGAPATARPIRGATVPQHPFMAPNGRSNIHDDAYQTDAYTGPGPLGRAPLQISTLLGAECASLTFDTAGRIVTICVGVDGPRLFRLDPTTLGVEAVFPL